MGYFGNETRVVGPQDIRTLRHMLEQFYMHNTPLASHDVEAWAPPTDVYETQNDIIVKMSLPGVRPNDIKIKISGDTVLIRGKRDHNLDTDIVSVHQMEIRYGFFERRITIHKPFDGANAAARYEDGFLMLRIPKAARLGNRVVVLRLKLGK